MSVLVRRPATPPAPLPSRAALDHDALLAAIEEAVPEMLEASQLALAAYARGVLSATGYIVLDILHGAALRDGQPEPVPFGLLAQLVPDNLAQTLARGEAAGLVERVPAGYVVTRQWQVILRRALGTVAEGGAR